MKAALAASIAKWRDVLEGRGVDLGFHNCPLCKEFLRHGCRGCPVAAMTGRPACRGSAYEKWAAAHRGENYPWRADTKQRRDRAIAVLRELQLLNTR